MTTEKEKREWVTRPYDPDQVKRLVQLTKAPPIVVQTLAARKISSPERIRAFLAPANLATGLYPPERLPGCLQAARLLAEAIRADKKIVVYGDYDVDGMTATAILLEALRTCGAKRSSYYLPNRLGEGYGLHCESLKRLREDEEADVVVTVDCGISSVEEAEYAKELGLQLIVTDHHTPTVDPDTQKQIMPDAAAIVHPKYKIEGFPPYPFPEICGAFVAFKLAWALGKETQASEDGKTGPQMREFLLRAIGLAALGTIADVVPLHDENRTLVRFAIDRSFVDHMPLGLERLLEVAKQDPKKKLSSEDVGFTIAPRLNAAGREVVSRESASDPDEKDVWKRAQELLKNSSSLASAGQLGLASLGVELLMTNDPRRAAELAPFIDNLNATRKKIENQMKTEAFRMIRENYADAPAFVLAKRDWRPGVIGIVAGRVAETFNRPTILVALREAESGTGSARSVQDSNFNLYDALNHCSSLLTRFGGHASAAGLGVKESNVDAFREAFCAYVAEHFEYAPKLLLDGELPLAAVTLEALNDLEQLAPFGAENQRPVFCSCGVQLVGPARRMGKGLKPTDPAPHFNARFRQFQSERRAFAFSQGEWADQMNEIVAFKPDVKFDIAFTIQYNSFNGGSVELKLLDWRESKDR